MARVATTIMHPMRGWTIAALVGVLLACTTLHVKAQGGVAGSTSRARDMRDSLARAMRAAEDARLTDSVSLAPLLAGLRSNDVTLHAQAIRGLGRFERPQFAALIAPFATSPSVEVRMEVADALAQTAAGLARADSATATSVLASIVDVLRGLGVRERDSDVRAAIARSIARLPYRRSADATAADSVLRAMLAAPRDTVALVGALSGIESLARLRRALGVPSAPTIEAIRPLATDRRVPARARRLALATLSTMGQLDSATLRNAVVDPDAQVRRIATAGVAAIEALSTRDPILRSLMKDAEPIVRIEAIRGWARRFQASDCVPLREAVRDQAPPVSLVAIDALVATRARSCPAGEQSAIVGTLVALVRALPAAGVGERTADGRAAAHRAAHAFVTLASIAPDSANLLLPALARHTMWQVRMYTARAAATLNRAEALVTLARDADGNVREAAIDGLARTSRHETDSLYVAALSARQYQTILAAVRALAGTPNRDAAVPALLAALQRITAERRETSRDARMAILMRLKELGSPATAPSLIPYLSDFDVAIADSAAALVSRWTSTPRRAAPSRLPPADAPLEDPAALRGMRVRFTMAPNVGGGSFEVVLFPDEAPATVARFLRLIRAKYYDGLTFHRVVPNFVIQGGSPAANEYVGDGPYMRDELSLLSNERGTLGISTRGRDLGDAQIFVNTVDSPRLDFDYTVFARVVSGMATIDGILEGDAIDRVEIVR